MLKIHAKAQAAKGKPTSLLWNFVETAQMLKWVGCALIWLWMSKVGRENADIDFGVCIMKSDRED